MVIDNGTLLLEFANFLWRTYIFNNGYDISDVSDFNNNSLNNIDIIRIN